MIDTVLSSGSATIIAGAIAAFVAIYVNYKSGSVTLNKENSEWRMRITKNINLLIEYINNANKKGKSKINLYCILEEIKNDLNPYGEINEYQFELKENKSRFIKRCRNKEIKNKTIYQDSHIWKLINDIEENLSDKDLNKKLKQLIGYLRLLLKFHWENTKFSVKGNIIKRIAIISSFVSSFSMLYFYNLNNTANAVVIELYQQIIFWSIFFIIAIFPISLHYMPKILYYFVCGIFYIIIISLFIIAGEQDSKYLLFSAILLLISFLLSLMSNDYSLPAIRKKYIKNIAYFSDIFRK